MNDPKSLWMHQDVNSPPLSLEQLRERSNWLEKKIRQRNLVEYIAAAIVIPIFTGYAIFLSEPMVRLGSVMIIVGVLYVMWELYRRASPAKLDPSATATHVLAFHRAELLRQQRALEGVWLWYIGPMVPGLLVFVLGPMFMHGPHDWVNMCTTFASFAAFFAGVYWLNWRVARQIRREIERLDALARE